MFLILHTLNDGYETMEAIHYIQGIKMVNDMSSILKGIRFQILINIWGY